MATEEQGKKISDDLMKQIIETGEKAGEMGFMHLDTDEPVNDTPFTGKIMTEFWKRDQDGPQTVPLAIYIGTEKFIVGTATVLGRKVHAQIKPADGRQLERLVTEGLITGVSVYFDKAGPAEATAVLPFQNEKTESKPFEKYNVEPMDPMKHIPDIEKPLINPFRTMPPPVDGTILNQETYKKIKIDNVPEGLPKLKGLRVTHEIVDEITHDEYGGPWKDKYPYGKA